MSLPLGDLANSTYKYEPLRGGQIRLLEVEATENGPIRCNVEIVNLDATPLYDALSYTWGDPRPMVSQQPGWETTQHTIYLNGCLKEVTTNLHKALLRVRSLRSEQLDPGSSLTLQPRIWIDALSINQNDQSEKSIQVSRMTDIYKGACTVIAWLGEADEHTTSALEVLRSLAKVPENNYPDHRSRTLNELGVNDDDKKWTSLVALFCRAWFNRVWVIQEVVLARRMYLIWGQEVISPDVIGNAANYVIKAKLWPKLAWHARAFATAEQVGKEVPSATSVLGAFSELGSHVRQGLLHPKLVSVFGRGCRATNLRDHFYGSYGLINEAISRTGTKDLQLPPVDYDQTVEDVFVQWAKFMIEEQENYILFSMVEDKSHRKLTSLPSWVPDLTVSMIPQSIGQVAQRRRWCPAGERTDGKIICTENSMRIRTSATRFDFVTTAANAFEHITNNAWSEILTFARPLVSMNDSYKSPLEALARTLIAGDYENITDAASLQAVFVEWFLSMVLGSGNNVSRILQGYALLLSCARKREEIPPMANLMAISRDPERLRRIKAYDYRRRPVTDARRLFLTSRNYMGIATRSIQEGDEVWIMPGATAPVVLREADDQSYILMGEAYVDGIMDGEAASWTGDDALDWIEIEIS